MNPDITGAFGIGFVIIYITMIFVTKLKEYTPQALTSIISLIAGGAIAGFLNKPFYGYYNIGVFVGSWFYWIVYLIFEKRPARMQKTS